VPPELRRLFISLLASASGELPVQSFFVFAKCDEKALSSSVALLFRTHPHPDERPARLGQAMGASFDKLKASKTLPERLVKVP
jgi:hypothetical protein